MRSLMIAILIAFAAVPVFAQDSDKSVTAEVKAEKKYKPPPGYKTRHRGDNTIYCRKSAEIGSRFPVEKCYTQEQLKEFLLREEAARQEFERQRRICSNPNTCSSG